MDMYRLVYNITAVPSCGRCKIRFGRGCAKWSSSELSFLSHHYRASPWAHRLENLLYLVHNCRWQCNHHAEVSVTAGMHLQSHMQVPPGVSDVPQHLILRRSIPRSVVYRWHFLILHWALSDWFKQTPFCRFQSRRYFFFVSFEYLLDCWHSQIHE